MNSIVTRSGAASRYGPLSIGLHWLTLLLIAAVYALMEFRGIFPRGSAGYAAMKHWHYVLGLTVLVIALVRLALRVRGRTPSIEPRPPRWQTAASHGMHLLLYVMMIGLPLVGWAILSAKGQSIPFFGVELPPMLAPDKALGRQIEGVHETIANVGYFLIGLHAIAALWHHYVVGDNTLVRMLPGRRG